jgi:hypothetical protein
MPVVSTVTVEIIGDPPAMKPDYSATVRLYFAADGKSIGWRDVEMTAAEMLSVLAAPGDPAISLQEKLANGIYAALIARGEISGVIVPSPPAGAAS